MKEYYSLLVLVLALLNEAKSEDLLELSCLNEMECKQFEHTGIKSDCMFKRCLCTTTTGEHVKCQPMEHKLNNIIGGPCPCRQPNAECNQEQDTCYCATDFMPSSDKRRCIKNLLELSCLNEMECKQFEHTGIKSDCMFKRCLCTTTTGEHVKCQPMEHKLNNIIGGPCPCRQPNAECNQEQDTCYCATDFMPSSDKRRCIKNLLELSCLNEMECKQFEHTGIKSDCMFKRCLCTTTTGEHVKCQPMEHKLNNIIGGPCPCRQPNAECNQEQDTCYCATDFMPSSDKRRCIKKTAALLDECELDLQCQKGDYNAICSQKFKECRCMDNFVIDEGKCVSIVGPKYECSNDTQCTEKFGDNTRCIMNTVHCACTDGYIASLNNTYCQKESSYLEDCTENMQCMASMGLGGRCIEKSCQCDEEYFVEEKKSPEGVLKTICSPLIKRGQYCRYEEDCYQRQLDESQQSMTCIYGECDCKSGFNVFNDGDCFQGGAALKSYMDVFVVVLVAFVVNIA